MNDSISNVLVEISERVEPADPRAAARALSRLSKHAALSATDRLPELVARLAAIGNVGSGRPVLLVCGSDHGHAKGSGSADALQRLATGETALSSALRSSRAQLVVVDCGVRDADEHSFDNSILQFRIGNGTRDSRREAAMEPADALASVHCGIALTMSLAGTGLDVLGLGSVGAGQDTASQALADRLLSLPQTGSSLRSQQSVALEALAQVGGFELGALAGAIVGAASIQVPIVLDATATLVAALLAARLCPAISGYLIASHSGSDPSHAAVLSHLGLAPLLDLGISSGEGTAAAMAFPLVLAAARVLAEIQ